jgi:DNA polymerase-3 subunit beta
MKFTSDKNKLADAVSSASKACAPKALGSALDGVLLSLSGEKLTVTGYDLEMGIRTSIFVSGEEDGDIIADAKVFGDFVRKMPADSPVQIEVKKEQEIHIRSGKRIKEKIIGKSGNNFPSISALNNNIFFKLKEKTLKEALTQVYHAVAQSSDNPSLCGVKFSVDAGVLTIVASDGTRVAMRKMPLQYEEIEFVVPEKAVLELIRNLSDDDEDKYVEITLDYNQVSFTKENYMIFSRLLEGKFIDFNRVANSIGVLHDVIVDTAATAEALERALVSITDRLKSPISCQLIGRGNEAVMKLSCKTNLAVTDEDIEISYKTDLPEKFNEDGESVSFKIAFNPRYLLDALKNCGSETVQILFQTDMKPFKVLPVNSKDDLMFIIVPMRM